jgi:hypothetical protein
MEGFEMMAIVPRKTSRRKRTKTRDRYGSSCDGDDRGSSPASPIAPHPSAGPR